MQLWSRLKSLARNLLRKPAVESELDEELQSYADTLIEERIAAGMPPAEARRSTLAELGGLEQVKQSVRDRRAGVGLELLWQDVRYALRQLNRNRAFTVTAVLTLALGIGATTAIFSAVYALLLRPLPYPEPDRLVYISQVNPTYHMPAMLSQDFVAAQTATKSFEQYAGYYFFTQNLTGGANPVRVIRAGVTANLFPTLGAVPQLGRLFTPDDDRQGGPQVMILSDHIWRSQFHSDPAIIGKSAAINGKPQTIIGILPRSFSFPELTVEPDVYLPADLDGNTKLAVDQVSYSIRTIARLRSGIDMQQAQAELQAFFTARDRNAPREFADYLAGRKMLVEPLQHHIAGDNRKTLLVLLACVAAVLFIACVNIANLQLARAVYRRHETALRGALGASRLRLVRQTLTESVVLSSFAAFLGTVIAVVIDSFIRGTASFNTSQIPSRMTPLQPLQLGKLSGSIRIDGWVLVFTIGLALVTTVLFGLAPAISGSRLDLRDALQSAAMRISHGGEQRALRHSLLIAEVALAVVLLASAGLLLRSFVNVLRFEAGFDPSDTFTGTTLLYSPRYLHAGEHGMLAPSPDRIRSFVDNLLPLLKALPGVQSAAIAGALPLGVTDGTSITFGSPAAPPPIGERESAPLISITPDYFRTVGTPVIRGRAFNNNDTATSPLVAIVNQAFAKRYFNGDALGQRFNRMVAPPNQFVSTTIVGIAEDVRHNGIERQVSPEFYLPESQAPSTDIYIALRSNTDPILLANAMRKAVLAVDPEQPLFDIETMDQRVSDLVAQRRLIMLLIACFAALAVILSAVGVYGVFAYSVSQRTQEMGIRLALGASRRRLLALIVAQAARLIAIGGVLGLGGAFLLSRLLTSMLVGVQPHDAVSFSVAWLLMTVVALLASMIPASHAARTDLVSILHAE
jgi:predicted permease